MIDRRVLLRKVELLLLLLALLGNTVDDVDDTLLGVSLERERERKSLGLPLHTSALEQNSHAT